MDAKDEYWRRNRDTFLDKEGFPHVVTLSQIPREEGTAYEAVVEELVGINIAYGWSPVYIRVVWFARPIEGSCVQANIWEQRMISVANYEAFLEHGTAALPQIWRAVCSCGLSGESRWRDHPRLFMHPRFAEPGTEHVVTLDESPVGDWTWAERTRV